MPFGGSKVKIKERLREAVDATATAVASGVREAQEIVRDDNDKREKLALRARTAAEAASVAARVAAAGLLEKTKTKGGGGGGGEGTGTGSSQHEREEAAAGNLGRIPPGEVGQRLSGWGFRPLRPVALFNSLSGCQTEVVSSTRMPNWNGSVLWVEPTKLGSAAVSNLTSQVSPLKAAAKDRAWRRGVLMDMDENGDGDVDADEIAAFVESNDELRDDPDVQSALENAAGKSSSALLADLSKPGIRGKLIAALLDDRDCHEHETMHLQTADHRTSGHEWTRHMQLMDGWRDPEGIQVRPKAGLEAMECLVANDTTGLAAKLGAGLMVGVTSQLRAVGYVEGRNLLACGYDWRAPCTKLEERDGHFSKVMDDIEGLVENNGGEAAVIVTHSLGGVCAHYFFHWVAISDAGRARGGVSWLDRHVHSFVPIGGPMLGTPYGSHSFLGGDEGQGIAPLLVSFADRHLLIRSWGMFPMIFPSGRHLMLQPAASPHWVRREGVLRVHVLSVSVPDDYWSLKRETRGNGKSKSKSKEDDRRKHTVELSFRPPETDVVHRLKTTSRRMQTDAAFDEQFQFAWSSSPTKIDGAQLTVSLNRLRDAGVKQMLSGIVDDPVASGTFGLGCDGGDDGALGNPPEHGRQQQTCGDLKPNHWSKRELRLEGGVLVTVRLLFVPHGSTIGPGRDDDFTRTACAGDPGAWRCGGPADSGTTSIKRERLLQTLGAEAGTEWYPVATTAVRMTKRDAAKHGRATYEPARVDEVMVLDGMKHEYEWWQKCYADDPVWRDKSTEAPPVRRCYPIYGINIPTLVGSVFRHQTKRYARDEPTTSLKLDKYCDVAHPGYSVKNGVVSEVPHVTPQADGDPTISPEEITYQTRASGDGTVAYWSLRWPVSWRNAGVDVEGPLEVEGAGHRDILDKPECIAAVLGECCSHPITYVEIHLGGIITPHHPSDEQLILKMDWRGVKMVTETVRTKRARKIKDEKRQFTEQRFVLGVTQRDIDEDHSLVLEPLTSLDDILKGATPVTFPIGRLLSGEVPNVLSFDDQGEMSLSWDLHCYPADEQGMPKQYK